MINERVCRNCPRKEACPGTENRTCLKMALEVVDELGRKLGKALCDLETQHPEGRCGCCKFRDDVPVKGVWDDFVIPTKCRECDNGSNWAWDDEI